MKKILRIAKVIKHGSRIDEGRLKMAIQTVAKTRTHHLAPNLKGGWAVKKAGRIILFGSKREALMYVKKIIKKDKGELVIHNKEGKVVASDRYGPVRVK